MVVVTVIGSGSLGSRVAGESLDIIDTDDDDGEDQFVNIFFLSRRVGLLWPPSKGLGL